MQGMKPVDHVRRQRVLAVKVLLLLVTLAIVFDRRYDNHHAAVVDDDDDDDDADDNGGIKVPLEQPLVVPSSLANLYSTCLSNTTRHSLQLHASSPQRRAWDFLLDHHQNMTHLSEWKKTQMFALATFYEALLGDPWPQPFLRERYMLHDRDVCDWSYPDPSTAYSEIRQCNEKGEVTGIEVTELDLLMLDEAELDPEVKFLSDAFLPPELALLTSLRSITLIYDGINAPLAQFLSPETTRGLSENCESLEHLNLWANQLWGTIPTELGLLTQLRSLSLSGHSLSGTLPSELGLMTSLTALELPRFDLEQSSVPMELEWMVSSETLVLEGDDFTGY